MSLIFHKNRRPIRTELSASLSTLSLTIALKYRHLSIYQARCLKVNSVVILFSYHHKNTEKVAQVIAKTLGAEIKKPVEIDPNSVSNYDLVGFGSGVYLGKLSKELLELADKIPQVINKKAFIYSTSGRTGKAASGFHKILKEKLVSKGFTIVGEFNCAGFDTYGVLKIAGGIKKGRPSEDDLKQANAFALALQRNESSILYVE